MGSIKMKLLDWLGNSVESSEEVSSELIAQNTAFQVLAIYIAVSYVSNAISNCEFKVYRAGKEVKDYLYYLLNVSPNPNQNATQLKREMIEKYYLDGRSLLLAKNDQLYLADSFNRQKMGLSDDLFDGIVVNERYQELGCLKANEVFCLEQSNIRVSALINKALSAYSRLAGVSIESYAAANVPKYQYDISAPQAGDQTQAEKFQEIISDNFKAFIKSDRSAVLPQHKGRELKKFETGTGSSVADVNQIKDEMFTTAAQAFRIPQSMMLGNINNMAAIVKAFLTFCVDPIAQEISDEATRKLIDYYGWKSGDYITVDTSLIEHVDLFSIASSVEKLIYTGLFTPDGIRQKIGEAPINDEFSQAYYLTKNIAPANDLLNSVNIEGGEQ